MGSNGANDAATRSAKPPFARIAAAATRVAFLCAVAGSPTAASAAGTIGSVALVVPAGDLVVPAGSTLVFRVNAPLSSNGSKTNDRFTFTTVSALTAHDKVVVPAGAQGTGTLLVAGHAGASGHEGDLTLRLDAVEMADGATLEFADQRIHLNGRNRKVIAGVLGFVPYAGLGARFIRGQESVVNPSTEIRTVLTADATVRAPARVTGRPSS